MLQKTAISVPLGAGLDTKTSDPLVVPARLTRLENAVFTRSGEIQKRNGFQALPAVPGGAIIGDALATFDRELLLAGSGNLFAYSPELGWATRGTLRSLAVKASTVWADHTDQTFPSIGTLGGVTAVAYESSAGGVYLTVTDEATGSVLLANKLVDTLGSKPTVVPCGGYLYVVYLYKKDAVSAGLRWKRLAPGTPTTLSGATVLVGDTSLDASHPYYAVRAYGGGMVLLYSTAADDLQLTYVDPAGAVADATTGYFDPVTLAGPHAGLSALALATAGQDGAVWVLYALGTQVYAAAYDQTLTNTRTLGTVGAAQANMVTNLTAAQDAAGAARVFLEVAAATGQPASNAVVRQVRVPSDNSSAGSVSDFYRSVGLGSEAWYQDGLPHVALAYDSSTQAALFVADTTKKIVARVLVTSGGGLAGYPKLPSVAQLAAGRWALVVGSQGSIEVLAKQKVYITRTITRLDLDFTSERFRSVQLGRNLHLAGAAQAAYDGAQLFEAGFHVYPEKCSVSGQEWVLSWKDGTPGVKITINITPPPDVNTDDDIPPALHSGARVRPGSFLTLFPNSSAHDYFWFTVDGVGSDPAPWPDVTGRQVDLLSTDDQTTVAGKLAASIRSPAYVGGPNNWTASVIAGNVVVASPSASVVIGTTDYTLPPVQEGSFLAFATFYGDATHPEKTSIICPAGKWISGGQCFFMESSTRNAASSLTFNARRAFYFVVDGVGSAPQVPDLVAQNDLNVTVPIAINSTDTAAAVAIAVRDAINGAHQGVGVYLWTAALDAANAPRVNVQCHVSDDASYGAVATHAYSHDVAAPLVQGNRQYYALYRWTDAQGQLHRSAPSKAFYSITGAPGGGSNIVSVGTYRLTRRPPGAVFVDVYRTDAAGGEAVPKLVKRLANNAAVDAVSFTDDTTDSDLQYEEPIYTGGGELGNDPPPPSTVLGVHQGRLWSVDENGVVWFSKPFANGLAIAWSQLLTFRVDKGLGSAVAVTTLDDKGIIWKTDSILAFAGSGPDNAGGGSGFTDPQVISSDVGCVSPESLVLTPQGWLFQSKKGLYLLDRDLHVSYVGAAVEGFNAQDITSATLMPGVSQVRFTTSAGQSLVYDYVLGLWGSNTYVAAHALLWGDSYVRLSAAGLVYQETPGAYVDEGGPVRLLARTSWLKLADVQGYGRVYKALLLGRYLSKHTLVVGIAYDYDDTERDTLSFDAGTLLGGAPYGTGTYGDGTYGGLESPVEQVDCRPSIQKCEAVRLEFRDQPQDSGASLALVHLQLVVGVKGPGFRPSVAKTI